MTKVQTGISLEQTTFQAIERVRGNVPRTRVYEDLINRGLESIAHGVQRDER
jgi:hypothetical protein